MNKNGFAISTLLYGISLMGIMIVILMMSIMSTNRKNTSTLSKDIEEELNRISVTNTVINTSGEDKAYTVPQGESGWYKIQLWGAHNGDYTSGIIYLSEGQELYFDIGTDANKKDSVVKVTDDSNTCKGGIVKDFTVIMRAKGGGSGPISQSGTDVTTGSYISGYPGVKSYTTKEMSEDGHRMDGYTAGGLSFKYRPYEVDNDDHKFADGTTNKPYAFLDSYIVLSISGQKDGKAKIERVSTNGIGEPPITLTTGASNLVSIKDEFGSNNSWKEIQLLSYDGGEVRYLQGSSDNARDGNLSTKSGANKLYSISSIPSGKYYALGIYHDTKSNDSTNQTLTITMKKDGVNKAIVFKPRLEDGVGQLFTFYKNSFWGFKTGEFPDACDVWISQFNERKSLITSNTQSNSHVTKNILSDSQNQKWHLERISGNNFKILESTKNYSLRIDEVDEDGGNAEKDSSLSTVSTYNNLKEEQWTLEAADNGAFYIKSTQTTTRNGESLYLIVSGVNLKVDTTKSSASQFYLKNLSY